MRTCIICTFVHVQNPRIVYKCVHALFVHLYMYKILGSYTNVYMHYLYICTCTKSSDRIQMCTCIICTFVHVQKGKSRKCDFITETYHLRRSVMSSTPIHFDSIRLRIYDISINLWCVSGVSAALTVTCNIYHIWSASSRTPLYGYYDFMRKFVSISFPKVYSDDFSPIFIGNPIFWIEETDNSNGVPILCHYFIFVTFASVFWPVEIVLRV